MNSTVLHKCKMLYKIFVHLTADQLSTPEGHSQVSVSVTTLVASACHTSS